MSKIKIIILLVLSLFLLYSSCSEHEIYDDDFYSLLNGILSKYDSTSVVVDTPKNYKLFKYDETKTPIPPPTSISTTTIRYIEMEWLKEDNYLNESDITFMLDQTKQITLNKFDATKIKYKTINKDAVDLLYQHYGALDFWDKLYEEINSYHVIFISKPLFNSDKSKMYFQIEYFCGGLCGDGIVYVCEKRNNEWDLIFQFVTWES